MDCPCPGDASSLPVVDQKQDMVAIFVSFLVLSITMLACSVLGVLPPNPSVHWAGHAWIHFMKRLHVIMSIGCFLTELCSAFFSLFAIHRILFGGFSMQASSAAGVLLRELEFELVAVCSYFFTGWILLMGPVAIRCFCMAQQQLRSDSLAASVCCLFVGVGLLILSFFNAHLSSFPYGSYENIVVRFVQLSLQRCVSGGSPAVVTLLSWGLQGISIILALISLVETFPWNYYRSLQHELIQRECLKREHASANATDQDPSRFEDVPASEPDESPAPLNSTMEGAVLPLGARGRISSDEDMAAPAATIPSRCGVDRLQSLRCRPAVRGESHTGEVPSRSLGGQPGVSTAVGGRSSVPGQSFSGQRRMQHGMALSVGSSMQSLDSLVVD